jgi:hypothetical protein
MFATLLLLLLLSIVEIEERRLKKYFDSFSCSACAKMTIK